MLALNVLPGELKQDSIINYSESLLENRDVAKLINNEMSEGSSNSADSVEFVQTVGSPSPIGKIFAFPKEKKEDPLNDFVAIQKWEGYVLSVKDSSFIARLIDLKNNQIDEEAEFLLSEVSEDDKKLMVNGAVFYWSVGYYNISGQKMRSSVIRFRRLPQWNNRELQDLRNQAQQIAQELNWN